MRECTLVGIGTNNTATNIANHDAYSLGEFKDDCFQGHVHYIRNKDGAGSASGYYLGRSSDSWGISDSMLGVGGTIANTNDPYGTYPRVGNVTRGKRKGVNYLIKAL